MKTKSNQVVFTNKARCRDCYRCLRACPVKAIKMENGQAAVMEDLCIACGTCIRECPQGAKDYRRDVYKVHSLLKNGQSLAVSLAPSFAAVFSSEEQKRLPDVLRSLGFCFIAETSVGAYEVALKSANLIAQEKSSANISTACPAVVNYIEKYHHHEIENLLPVVSPMIAHAKMIQARLGENVQTVFIGPCIAKKKEADRSDFNQLVAAVLTFEELQEWLAEEEISFADFEPADFDERPQGQARLFPLEGGLLKTATLNTDLLARETISVSGFDNVFNLIDQQTVGHKPKIIEPLFCEHGCINGPAMGTEINVFERRNRLLDYAERDWQLPAQKSLPPLTEIPDLTASFSPYQFLEERDVSEEEILQVYKETGKENIENRLDCGACGYNTCRQKAIAVVKGMAEKEMCVPFMRRRAEQRTDKIIETSPNGILIIDEKFNIISVNQAFKKMFMCSDGILGKPISYLIDPDPFEFVFQHKKNRVDSCVKYERYNLVCHLLAYYLSEANQYVGIFINITDETEGQIKLEKIKVETIKQSEELLEYQVAMAQQLAKFLGESTAREEELIENLKSLVADEPAAKNEVQQKKSKLEDLL